jgi:hypothetical protein
MNLRLLIASSIITTLSVVNAVAQSRQEIRISRNGHTYLYVPGSFTAEEGYAEAARRGGYPVVFSDMAEFQDVMNGLGGFRNVQRSWTGHYQHPQGAEPAGDWTTVTGERSAPLGLLFNGRGPDDGKTRSFKPKIKANIEGKTIRIGGKIIRKVGKNEDFSVIWFDNRGLLEDVTAGFDGSGVIVEINR